MRSRFRRAESSATASPTAACMAMSVVSAPGRLLLLLAGMNLSAMAEL